MVRPRCARLFRRTGGAGARLKAGRLGPPRPGARFCVKRERLVAAPGTVPARPACCSPPRLRADISGARPPRLAEAPCRHLGYGQPREGAESCSRPPAILSRAAPPEGERVQPRLRRRVLARAAGAARPWRGLAAAVRGWAGGERGRRAASLALARARRGNGTAGGGSRGAFSPRGAADLSVFLRRGFSSCCQVTLSR